LKLLVIDLQRLVIPRLTMQRLVIPRLAIQRLVMQRLVIQRLTMQRLAMQSFQKESGCSSTACEFPHVCQDCGGNYSRVTCRSKKPKVE
jgi:hypothetical protein